MEQTECKMTVGNCSFGAVKCVSTTNLALVHSTETISWSKETTKTRKTAATTTTQPLSASHKKIRRKTSLKTSCWAPWVATKTTTATRNRTTRELYSLLLQEQQLQPQTNTRTQVDKLFSHNQVEGRKEELYPLEDSNGKCEYGDSPTGKFSKKCPESAQTTLVSEQGKKSRVLIGGKTTAVDDLTLNYAIALITSSPTINCYPY